MAETETLLTRDELLVFNTMCFLEEHVECPAIAGYLAAFERDNTSREMLMTVLVAQAESGFQRVFTVPEDDECH